LDKVQGGAEERSESYMKYGERASEATTQRFAKNASSATSLAGWQAGVVRKPRGRYRRTSLIIIFCLSILGGIGLARVAGLQISSWFLILLIPSVLIIRRKNLAAIAVLILLGTFLGWWRGSQQLVQLNELKSYAYQKVTVQAVATTDAIYGNKSQLSFEAHKIQLLEPEQKPLLGTFKLSGFGVPMVYRGDMVRVEGKLYLTRGAKQASISYGQIERVAAGRDWLASLRRNFAAGMQSALPEPAASLGLGLLIGQRSTLPTDVLAAMTTVGLVHIVAVSGYNVTILARAVQRLRFTRSKYQKLILALALIGTFVLITGFSASVVRAAIVSLLSLIAWYYGRDIRPLVLIAFVAALTGLINPLYVWSDIGWYLSFLAFCGVLIIAPLIARRLFGEKAESKPFSMLILESFSAQLMTLPLILVIFGRFSVVSLLANILVVPLVPIAMLLSACAGLAGMIAPTVAGWIAWPAMAILTYMVDVIKLFAAIPMASTRLHIGWADMLLCYAVILLLALAFGHKNNRLFKRLITQG